MDTLKAPKPASEERGLANRASAAKSTGPATPQDQRKSTLNVNRDSLLASTVLIKGENHDAFLKLAASLREKFQPGDPVETCLLDSLIVAEWRRRRFWKIQNFLRQPRNADSGLATTSFETFRLYKMRCDRKYRLALSLLQEVQRLTRPSSGPFDPANRVTKKK